VSAYGQRLKIAYVEGRSLPIGTSVMVGIEKIGSIYKYELNKTFDTLIAILSLDKKYKIPSKSEFIFYENLFGPSSVIVKFSNETTFLNFDQVVFGRYERMQLRESKPDKFLDSLASMILWPPKIIIDSTKLH